MINQKSDLIYNISIHYSSGCFYITSMIRDASGFRIQVLPLYKLLDNETDNLAKFIEIAKMKSNIKYNHKINEFREEKWSEEDERIWNAAEKVWDVIWREDGSVSINPALLYAKHKEGSEWRFIKDAKKIIQPPVTSQDVASEIIKQVRENTYGNAA